MMDLVVLAAFLVLVTVNKVGGDGTLQVKLVNFNNPGGKGSNGHCCDGKWGFCESGGGCDHYFIVCIDSFSSREDSISQCPFGRQRTNSIHNQATISFGSVIGSSTANPISFNFSRWQTGVRIKVDVWDDDNGGDDHVDFIKTAPLRLTPGNSSTSASWTSATLRARTSMTVEVRAFCDANWYGEQCGRYCVNTRGPNAFYICDNLGQKICDYGWEGENCDESLNECRSSPCQHGGSCEDGTARYICHCLEGYSGVNCEIDIDDCFGVNCHNGICVDGVNQHTCQCNPGFAGESCEFTDSCGDNPCLNNGTCQNERDGFNCICPQGWTGARCEVDIDECSSNPCINANVCENKAGGGFLCICSPGWTGVSCQVEVNECLSNPCLHNGTCLDKFNGYQCRCTEDWTSATCQIPKIPCQRQPDLCKNNGTCVEETYLVRAQELAPTEASTQVMADVRCQCLPGWTGVTCEESVPVLSPCSSMLDPCLHGGTCVPVGVGFQCLCAKGFFGIHCQLSARKSEDEEETEKRDKEKEREETERKDFTIWTVQAYVDKENLSILCAFITNVTKKYHYDHRGREDHSLEEENITVEHFAEYSVYRNKTEFYFRVKKDGVVIPKPEVDKILENVSVDSALFKENENFDRLESAKMVSNTNAIHVWLIVGGLLVFVVLVTSLVAALIILKRYRKREAKVSVSNPIYISGIEAGATLSLNGQAGTDFTLDRDSQHINSGLFLFPNEGYNDCSEVVASQDSATTPYYSNNL